MLYVSGWPCSSVIFEKKKKLHHIKLVIIFFYVSYIIEIFLSLYTLKWYFSSEHLIAGMQVCGKNSRKSQSSHSLKSVFSNRFLAPVNDDIDMVFSCILYSLLWVLSVLTLYQYCQMFVIKTILDYSAYLFCGLVRKIGDCGFVIVYLNFFFRTVLCENIL